MPRIANKRHLRSELPGMLTANPGHIVADVMRWPLKIIRSGDRASLIVQSPEENPVLIGISNGAKAFPHKPVPEVIHQGGRKITAVIRDNSLIEINN